MSNLSETGNQERSDFRSRTPPYAMHPRWDLLSLVPGGVKKVLEVGCCAGLTGGRLVERGCHVVGLEINPVWASEARTRLSEVIEGDAESLDLPFAPGTFDCLLYGDILEHLRDPWKLLTAQARLLVPGGWVVASIPNVRHWRVVAHLLMGRWEYTRWGIVEEGHLRFFTFRGIQEMFRQAGLEVLQVLPSPPFSWIKKMVTAATFGMAYHFLVYDYLILARKTGGSREGG